MPEQEGHTGLCAGLVTIDALLTGAPDWRLKTREKEKEAFDETTAMLECRAEGERRQKEHRCFALSPPLAPSTSPSLAARGSLAGGSQEHGRCDMDSWSLHLSGPQKIDYLGY
ncbi:unnamed protein product [Pleuronectes platessa]|uniref:Uncharacterized protein n=1 Tax=Pleuronectes platessa TaxID=8262 RepID=A0A9N7YKQ1_PLEPL|nr:unnamed protein product [Pleuronectes platessa]